MTETLIRAARPDDPGVRDLIARHVAQMAGQSPEDSCHVMDAAGLSGPGIRVFAGERGGAVIAIGALKDLGGGIGELKSMHTAAEARGTGAGRAMLRHLLDEARRAGLSAVCLETGSTGDFAAARGLYAAHGFREIGPFGDYGPDPWSVFMRLDLARDA